MPGLHSARNPHPQKRRWHVVRSLFFIFVFSLAVFVFLQSSFFKVGDIRVDGNKQLGREEIVALTGLSRGVNIFKANLQQAREKIALNPMVAKVDIKREFPRTITIEVTERKPVAIIPERGHFVVVGDDGYCLSKADNLSRINLPFITGIKTEGIGPGQKIPDAARITTALNYLLAMPLNVRAIVSELNVSDLNNIRMFTIDEAEVRFGDSGRIPDKIKLYQEVIGQKYPDRIQYMDISYKGSPVVKFNSRIQQDNGPQP